MSNEWDAETLAQLRGKAQSLGVRASDLDDFTQTVITHALANFDPSRSSLRTYLNRLAKWIAYSYYGDKKRESRHIALDNIPDLTVAPNQEHAAALNEVLADPDAAQAILYAKGWSYEDIGKARRVSRETVRKEIAAYREKNAARYGMRGKRRQK